MLVLMFMLFAFFNAGRARFLPLFHGRTAEITECHSLHIYPRYLLIPLVVKNGVRYFFFYFA